MGRLKDLSPSGGLPRSMRAPPKRIICVSGPPENGKRDVERARMGAALFGLCHKCHIYDVMRSTKKLEGLLNLIRAGAGEDGIYALAAAARSPRSEGSTRGGGSRSDQNGRYRAFSPDGGLRLFTVASISGMMRPLCRLTWPQ